MNWKNLGRTAIVCAAMAVASPAAWAASNTPQEEANKKLVVEFYNALDAANADGTTRAKARTIAEKYIGARYIQHHENAVPPEQAREAFIRMTEATPAEMPQFMRQPAREIAIMAEGDCVMRLTVRELPGPDGNIHPLYIFNMFRVADGKLVEHWDVLPAGLMPPQMPGK